MENKETNAAAANTASSPPANADGDKLSDPPCHLHRLPPELRNRIWEFAAAQDAEEKTTVRAKARKIVGAVRYEEAPLLRVNKQIRREAFGIYFLQYSLKVHITPRDFAQACAWIKYVALNAGTSKPFGRFSLVLSGCQWKQLDLWRPIAKLFWEMDLELRDEEYVPKTEKRPYKRHEVPTSNPASLFDLTDKHYVRFEPALEEVVALGKKGGREGWTEAVLGREFDAWVQERLGSSHVKTMTRANERNKEKRAARRAAPAGAQPHTTG
ncbi:hypothetical protein PRZ48_012886 [Zasmidium cellare]|uniref:2EXR domain-containing protein n=1 Tax=Zasmidium cellare TaxID=395010 RepID=A0ABR0E2G8_ZASCE|nr:hypothetical protein PRZ48_012886 [Zasmidium cellare]